ncbi:MAG TPA: tetratricopeptide repeat protein [Candidatus Sulfotelmatobacter sp.]|jgi:tetratricopeptide (TPR) repeat protein|nr:tetratricopeptide repeat protein [Candidatus Sulfotelmatobacter sp.]
MDLQTLLFEQAQRLEAEGNAAQAAQFYQRILEDKPDHADANAALGRLLCRQGMAAQGIGFLSRASSLTPDAPGVWLDLGLALQKEGYQDHARRALLSAASLAPDDPSLISALADGLRELSLPGDAARQYEKLAELVPGLAAAHNNLGTCLLELKRRDEALAAFRRAVIADPQMIEALSNLAMLCVETGRNEESISLYSRLRALRPDLVQAALNQGVAYYREGRLEEAAATLREAAALAPDNAQIHYNLAQVLLLKGNLDAGFAEYEWRWSCSEFPSPRLLFSQPAWKGEPLEGRTLLIHAEQGFGDVLQFCRLLPLAGRGGKVIFLCPAPLLELLGGMDGVDIVAEGADLPAFDLYCPLLSLPHLLGPHVHPEPPYLKAPHKRLFQPDARLHVGLVWTGNPLNGRNHVRRVPLEQMARLPALPDIAYHSLQYRPEEGWREAFPFAVDDLSSAISTFGDLAAAMEQLDLIISMCSAPVHLAGALNRPCWVLLHQLPDWRWGMSGRENPWYPNTRLYRQPSAGNWQAVIDAVSGDLADLAAKKKP